MDFYDGPEAARAAGFRACKRCRPDDFYVGHHPDEALVEGLVARVERDPGAFRDVGALATAAGVSPSKLHALVRTHYHATPAEVLTRARVAAAQTALLGGRRPVAEIAFAAGFESLSAFNDNFRRQAAMPPLAYRRALGEPAFALALPADYPIAPMLRHLGPDPQSPTERVAGRTYAATLRLDEPEEADAPGRAVTVRVDVRPGEAACRLLSPAPLGAAGFQGLHRRLLGTLGLAGDPARFEARVAESAELAPLLAGQRGLRIPLVADPFDGLVRAVVGQQVSRTFADALRRRLTQRVGSEAGGGLQAPPAPAAVAGLDPGDLVALGFSRAKAAYLVDAARAVANGRLPLAALGGASATRIERTLLAVRGVGPWSAHYVLMRAFGFPDCVPVGDVGLAAALARFFALDGRPDKAETLALMRRFGPYRSLATFHLWQRQGTSA